MTGDALKRRRYVDEVLPPGKLAVWDIKPPEVTICSVPRVRPRQRTSHCVAFSPSGALLAKRWSGKPNHRQPNCMNDIAHF